MKNPQYMILFSYLNNPITDKETAMTLKRWHKNRRLKDQIEKTLVLVAVCLGALFFFNLFVQFWMGR